MSSLNKLSVQVELSEINCGECGGTYAINERYREQCYKKGSAWNCPYCRTGWGYTGNSENEKLRKQLEKTNAELEKKEQARTALLAELKMAEHRERGLKGAATKLRNRVHAGVCPCCTRTFKQLAAHMKNKHPDYQGK